MKFCIKCSKELKDNDIFCRECGAAQPVEEQSVKNEEQSKEATSQEAAVQSQAPQETTPQEAVVQTGTVQDEIPEAEAMQEVLQGETTQEMVVQDIAAQEETSQGAVAQEEGAQVETAQAEAPQETISQEAVVQTEALQEAAVQVEVPQEATPQAEIVQEEVSNETTEQETAVQDAVPQGTVVQAGNLSETSHGTTAGGVSESISGESTQELRDQRSSGSTEYTHAGSTSFVDNKPKKKKNVLGLVLIGVAALIVLAGIFFAFKTFPRGKKTQEYLIYTKKGKEFVYNKKWKEGAEVGKFTNVVDIVVSKDNKYLFVQEGSKLIRRNIKNSKEEKIASGVSSFYVFSNSKVLYMKSGSLNMWNGKESYKIDKRVDMCLISQDRKTGVYRTSNGDLMRVDLKKTKPKPKELDSDIDNIITASNDLKKVFYFKDYELCCLNNFKTVKEFGDELTAISSFGNYKVNIYQDELYTNSDELTGIACDNQTGILYCKEYADSYEDITEDYDEDQYEADIVLGKLSGKLYSCDGKKAKPIADNGTVFWSGNEGLSLMVSVFEKESLEDKLEDYDDYDELKDDINESAKLYLLNKGKKIPLKMNIDVSSIFTDNVSVNLYEKDKVIFIHDEKEQNLYQIKYKGNKASMTLVDSDVEYFLDCSKGKAAYLKDYDSVDCAGELYIDGKKVSEDIAWCSVKGDSVVVVKYDDSDDDKYAIYKLDGKKEKLISDGIFGFDMFEDGSIAYIKDYKSKRGAGDLYTKNKSKKEKLIEENVSNLQIRSSQSDEQDRYISLN